MWDARVAVIMEDFGALAWGAMLAESEAIEKGDRVLL